VELSDTEMPCWMVSYALLACLLVLQLGCNTVTADDATAPLATMTAAEEKPVVIDVILYNGDPIGLFRMEYLKDVVDLVVVVECHMSFSGKKKDKIYLHDDEPVLKDLRMQNRLLEIEIDTIPFPKKFEFKSRKGYNATISAAWVREKYARGAALPAIKKRLGNSPYILIATDVDEIPRKEMVAKFASHYDYIGDGKRLAMSNHLYSFEWVMARSAKDGGAEWVFPFVITNKGIRQWEQSHSFTLADLRVHNTAMSLMPYILNAGWHCSFCSSVQEIVRKVSSFSHMELNRPIFRDPAWIEECITTGKDIFKRPTFLMKRYGCQAGLPFIAGAWPTRYNFLKFSVCKADTPSTVDTSMPPKSFVIDKTEYYRGEKWPKPPHTDSYILPGEVTSKKQNLIANGGSPWKRAHGA